MHVNVYLPIGIVSPCFLPIAKKFARIRENWYLLSTYRGKVMYYNYCFSSQYSWTHTYAWEMHNVYRFVTNSLLINFNRVFLRGMFVWFFFTPGTNTGWIRVCILPNAVIVKYYWFVKRVGSYVMSILLVYPAVMKARSYLKS